MSKTSRLIQLVDLSRLKQISFSGSSPDNQDFILGDAPDGSSQLPGMDGSDGYRRRRALLARENTAGRLDGGMQGNRDNRPKRKRDGDLLNQGVDSNRITHDSDGNSSDFSSRSTSDDVELYRVNSKDGLTDDEEAGLTKKDRQRRRRRRRKNTLMDQRVVTNIKASKQDRSLADMSVLRASLINALLIASWYFFSLSISIYNTWMFSKNHLDFHFPLFTTCMHMVVQFSLASLVLYFFPTFRPRPDSISNPHNHDHIRAESLDAKKPLMTRMFYISRIGPCGAATGLDIGLGNMSLKFITLTFFTMCKSSSLAFVLIFAFLFRLETPSIKLILIIATMTVGVIMMVAGETLFNALGFILIISSAFFSGFRWALTQILLLRNPATSNPFSSIFFLAPIMFLTLLLIAIPVEGLVALSRGLGGLIEKKGAVQGIGILLFPGVLAFLMTSSEFALLKRTSVVTLSICGIFKEVVTISAGGIVFHDKLTPIKVSGLLVTIASIAAYNYIKITKARNDARAEVMQASVTESEASQSSLLSTDSQNPAEGEGMQALPERTHGANGRPVVKGLD